MEMKKNNILDGLNENQREAVSTINGPLQIIAGAGSGKTRVLTHRIAYLIEQGIKPYNILALTFTNKAAKEMKHRIAQLIDEYNAERIWAGTFHSIFARILRYEANEIGYDNNFTIYDTEDSIAVLRKSVFTSIGISKETKENAVYSVISSAKNKLILPDKYAQMATTNFEKIVAECYREYQAHLLKNNCMDFDDLLVNMLRLLHIPNILAKYQDKFHYILIDEYQDTNKVQYSAINELAKHRQNICVVGDDAQSIYKWRGADIQNILNFGKDYPYCKTVKLKQNYRSTKNILAAADSVIKNNKHQLQKHLWTENDDGEKIYLMKLQNDRIEAKNVVDIINNKYREGEKLNQFAILYRTNAQSLVFENACRMLSLPYVVIGGMSFYKRKEVKDILAYLRLLVNSKDDNSLLRVINEPPRGIGATTVDTLVNFARKNSLSLLDALKFATSEQAITKKPATQINKLALLFDKHIQLVRENANPEHLVEFIQQTGVIDYYKEIDSDDANDRLQNIEQLLTDIISYIQNEENNQENSERNLQSYLEQVSLISDLDAKELAEDRVTLMTLHSAKGLEYDNVFIVGLENNLFPLASSSKLIDDMEEERRLFYVGITRARKTLTVSYCENRMKYGQFQQNAPSFFLKEIESDLLEDVMGNTFLVRKRNFDAILPNNERMPFRKKTFPQENYSQIDDFSSDDNYSQLPETVGGLRIGDVVQHGSFGIGKILDISGVGENQKITVHFSTVGRKQLLLKYARLEKMEQ
jgi:DNA helicase-2/ATP-dependent DNA helicase PcrA